jgi:hypothetical protein
VQVYFAFVLDMFLYSLFQAQLMGDAIPEGADGRWLRFVPFFGLSAWLLKASREETKALSS